MDELGMIEAFGGDTVNASGGSVTFASPGIEFDLGGFLSTATSAATGIAKTVGDFQLARSQIASANENAAFARFQQAATLDAQRAALTNQGNIERIKAAAELQRAANAANNSGILPTIFGNQAGDYSGLLAIAAVIGVVIAFMQYKKGK